LEEFNWKIFEIKSGEKEEKVQLKENAKEQFEEYIEILKIEKEKEKIEPITFEEYNGVITSNNLYTEVSIILISSPLPLNNWNYYPNELIIL